MTKNKRILQIFGKILLVIFSFSFCQSTATAEPGSHKNKITGIINSLGVRTNKIGISIRQVGGGTELVSINSERILNPASNIKILTSYCVLKNLGINYRWKTSIFTQSDIKNGTIKGDVYIKGNGDPYMVSETLWMFTKELLNRGIKRILGDLILDPSLFRWDKKLTAFTNDYDRSFTAIPSALSLNFNSITVYVYPQVIGKPPLVIIDPQLDYFVIENRAFTVLNPRNANPKISIEQLKDKTRIRIYGKWTKSSKITHYRKVFHPELYYGSAFKKFYADQGGKIEGKVKLGVVPEEAKEIVIFESRPLSQCIYGLNKFSNNFMATQMMLTLALEKRGASATRKKGLAVLKECLNELGISKKANVITSASGLSRNTRMSASQITSILVSTEKNYQISPEFTTSLSVYGDDGTVKEREIPGELKGLARVKTGRLSGVDALSGFVKTKKSNLIAFSIIANGFKEFRRDKYRKLQDNLILYIFKNL